MEGLARMPPSYWAAMRAASVLDQPRAVRWRRSTSRSRSQR